MKEKIFIEVKSLIEENSDILGKNIQGNTRLYGGEIGLSSLEMVSFIVKLEQKFGVEFPDEFLNRDLLVDDIVQWLSDK